MESKSGQTAKAILAGQENPIAGQRVRDMKKRLVSERTCRQGTRGIGGAGWHPAAEWHWAFRSDRSIGGPERSGLPTQPQDAILPRIAELFHLSSAAKV